MIWNDESLSELPEKNRTELTNTIKKYGENKWWESEDKAYVAMFQIFETVVMVNITDFRIGLGELLGRPVSTYELGLNIKGLEQEAIGAYDFFRHGKSLESTNQYKENGVIKSLYELKHYCNETGKGFIGILV